MSRSAARPDLFRQVVAGRIAARGDFSPAASLFATLDRDALGNGLFRCARRPGIAIFVCPARPSARPWPGTYWA